MTKLEFPVYENSNDLKSFRHETIMPEMRRLLSKERLTNDEQKELNDLEKFHGDVTAEIIKLEKQESDALRSAGIQIRNAVKGSGDTWINQATREKVTVLRKEDRAVDVFKSAGDHQRLSLGKAVRALILNDWRNAEDEQRALATTSGSGLLVPFLTFPEILDHARAKSVVADAGALFLPMDAGKMSIARITSDPAFETKAENELFAGSSIGLDAVTLSAQTIGTYVALSREVAQDGANFSQAITSALAKGLGQYIDQLALAGTGIGEPRGILNTDYVGSVTGDALLHHGHLVALWNAINSQNGQCKTLVMNPKERAFLGSQFNSNGYVAPPALLNTLQWFDTTAVPSNLGVGENESVVIAGDFSQLIVGVRDEIRVEVSYEAKEAFARHQVLLKVTARVDIALQHPRHFAKLTGVITPANFYNVAWPVTVV